MMVFLFLIVAGLSLSAGAATAVAQSSTMGGFKHDSSQPIEIASDTLEVRQADQVGVFAGNVRAKQGETYMRADTITVSYGGTGNADNGGMGDIKQVKANGNVFFSTGTESAQGNWAIYDVGAGAITMGDDVALTQSENVITGSKLNIDLNSGQARIEGGPSSSGRVKSIFVPQDN